ncbi:hypothetical protein D9757_004965 [Collybiopsis confluens]|uniref:Uncharacterized protein n=1 Tax=Collybiopsis confluens TaxID=2823264 RepID=A0A8H5HTF2_9AGAR|nr:hypothetical protein D9757_004965 [Collybiopsis confluens]
MSYDLSSGSSFRTISGPFSLEVSKAPLHVHDSSLSTSSSASSDDASNCSTTCSVNNCTPASSAPYDPRRRISALMNETPSSIWTFTSSKPSKLSKASTEHILVRARNANIPALLRRHFKQNSVSVSTGRRQAQQDSDPNYEEHRSSECHQPSRTKTKSSEQIEAEKRRMLVRKLELESDPLLDARKMGPNRVWCILCQKYIHIDSRRPYYATLWFKHRGKKHAQVTAPPRARELERRLELEIDPLLDARQICPDKVWCIPCRKYVLLDSRRPYYATLWFKHREKRHPDAPRSSVRSRLEARPMLERKMELETDPLLDARRMCPDKVWCIPCQKYVHIDSRRPYYSTLWFRHRGKRHPGAPPHA